MSDRNELGRSPFAFLAGCVAVTLVIGLLAFAQDLWADDAGSRLAPPVGVAPEHAAPNRQANTVHRVLVLGHSTDGRRISGVELGNPSSTQRLLVVGCIHGNEPAGIAITHALAREPGPSQAAVWVAFDLNPDGVALGTRQNGRGVDLNRNFPYRWRPIGAPGSTFYSGPRPASEAETRLAMRLISRAHPTISIWFHQHLDLVDLSGGNMSLERRFAQLVGLRSGRLPRYPGSAVNWENHTFPGTTSFVVELPGAALAPAVAERFADASLALVHAPS